MKYPIPPIFQVGDVLLSSDIITEYFCCDLDACKGACCIEGDAGAPVTDEEIAAIEIAVPHVSSQLSSDAKEVISRQGVWCLDPEGDKVTTLVRGKDCVFTCYEGKTCLCALEKVARQGKTTFVKPMSCALYPIREKQFADGTVGLNYHRWDICRAAVVKGRQLKLPLYRFLEGPLVKRFGKTWYNELCEVAHSLLNG